MKNLIFFLFFLIPCVSFSQELEVFKQGDLYGYKVGKAIIIQAQFEFAISFSEGLALCQKKGKFGFIDSTGKVIISFIYDKAGRMENGKALVSINKKMGVIDAKGNEIIKPIYSTIEKTPFGFWIYDKSAKGFVSNHGKMIPPLYTEIKTVGLFKNAFKSKFDIDIYYNDSLIIEHAEKPVEQRNITYIGDLIIQKNGNTGLFNPNKGWMIEPNYKELVFTPIDTYLLNGKNVNQLIVGKKVAQIAVDYPELFDFEPEVPYTNTVFKLNGEKISDIEFDAVVNYNDEFDFENMHKHFMAYFDNSLYILNANLGLDKYPYSSIEKHLNWWIAKDDNQHHILDEDFQKIASFASVQPDYRWINFDEQYFYEETDMIQEKIMEDYLIVSQNQNGVEQKAIFYLPAKKVISPWFEREFEINNIRNDNYFPVMFIYKYDNMSGYYVDGMETGSKTEYDNINTLNDYLILNRDSLKDELYQYFMGELKLVHREEQIFKSTNLYNFEQFVDEYGEPIGEVRLITYNHEFICTKGKDKKFGVYTFDGTIFPPIYDTLIQDISILHVINTVKNNKYGYIDLNFGASVKPIWDEVPPLDYFEGTYEIFARFLDKDDNPYFVDSKERIFYSTNRYHEIYKKGRKVGLRAFKNDDKNADLYIRVSARYKKLDSLNAQYGLYLAKGRKGTTGVISSLGDTIVPFSKQKISVSDLYVDPNGITFEIRKKNKVGLIGSRQKEILPAIYEEIKFLEAEGDEFQSYLVAKKNGKYGLFTTEGNEILSCEFDSLTVKPVYVYDSYTILYLVAKKDSKIRITAINNPFINIRKKINEAVQYDEVIGSIGIIYANGEYAFYDISKERLAFKSKTKDFTIPGNMFNIVVKNGKYGAEDSYGTSLIPCEYDAAEFLSNRPEIMFATKNGINYYIYVFDNLIYTEDQW